MTKTAASSTRYWLDQYDISGFMNAADMDVKQELPVVTGFSDAGPRRVVGDYDHGHTFGGFFDATAATLGVSSIDAVVDALRTAAAADHHLAELFAGTAEGAVAYESIVQLEAEPRKAKTGGAISLDMTLQGSNGLVRGQILRNATIVGNGTGTGRNIGASTLGQTFVVVFRVFSGTFTSFDWKIQESTDDAAGDPYADVAGLSGSVAAVGVTRVTTTAATEAWKQLVILNWVGTNAVIGCTAGIMLGS